MAVLAHGNRLSCREVCWQELVGELGRQEAWLRDQASLAADQGRALQPWQLVAISLLVASLGYNHGRWIGWICLSLSLLAVQSLYVAWQMFMIAWNVTLIPVVKSASLLFYVLESLQRWGYSGHLRERWALRRKLARSQTYDEYREAACRLDELDGKSAWRAARGGYPSSSVETAARQLVE